MGTRSMIVMKDKDLGKYRGVYCHWDGYPEHNGLILKDHYKDYDLVKELINLGSISSLNERIAPIGEHSFDKPEEGTTVFYNRDRKQDWSEVKPIEKKTIKSIIGKDSWCAYVYVFEDGKWHCWKIGKTYTAENEIDLDNLKIEA
jgi:hypothetical protein